MYINTGCFPVIRNRQSWPGDHTGWRLQAQTNSSGTGLGTNWVTVFGSDFTNLMMIPFSPANDSVFYRLAHP